MKSIKCSNCGLINFETQINCKRCNFLLNKNTSDGIYQNSRQPQNTAFSAGQETIAGNEPEDVKKNALKKIKWGLIISVAGFAITFGAISLGFFAGYENTDNEYLEKAKAFSFITLLPLAAVLAGFIELATGISIFDIIEKWEKLPQWLGWLIGIGVFLLIVVVLIAVAAVILFNFF